MISWANKNQVRWAFSDGNAGAYLTNFYRNPDALNQINWGAIAANDFRDSQIKEGKQAEFLIFDSFPWGLIETIGTIDRTVATKVQGNIANLEHQPVIAVEPGWYF
ncbi:MAG: DUF4433 domain-containing protein [Chloroflexi bacterium]|nr:DUF4433 domain-containing protein [Chloroflexota bacterium]